MCRTSNLNYKLANPIDVSTLGIHSSDVVVGNLTPTLTSAAIQNVKSQTAGSSSTTSNNNRKHNSRNHHHIVVQHHYHDHANEEDCIDDRPARGGVTTPFPIRLHKMLDKMEADGHGDVISWQPHGRCFIVRKPKEFKELLPIYFKLSKMSSFQRQLNLYGFQRLTRGRDKNGYYHEYFLRGKPSLSHKIQRTKVKGTGVRARSNPSTEPHLWEMTWVGTDAGVQQFQHHQHQSDAGSVSSHEDLHTMSPKPSPASAPKSMPQLVSSSAPIMPIPSSSSSTSAFMPPLTASSSCSKSAAMMAPPTLWSHQYVQRQPEDPEMQSVQQVPSSTAATAAAAAAVAEQDIIMSFGGKRFHYLDPEEMMKEAQLRKRQQDACKRDDMQSFMSNLELDNLYVQLDDDLVDDDANFMEMLERVIE